MDMSWWPLNFEVNDYYGLMADVSLPNGKQFTIYDDTDTHPEGRFAVWDNVPGDEHDDGKRIGSLFELKAYLIAEAQT